MRTFKEIAEALAIGKINNLANDIDKLTAKYEDSLSVSDFARTIANILVNQYGPHNFDEFNKVLIKEMSKY